MGKKLEVSVISPDKIIYSGDADSITVPGFDGEIGILWNHAPMIAEMGIGVIKIMDNNDPIEIVVDGGFIEVKNNQINILANSGEQKEKIDLAAVQATLTEIEKLAPSLEKVKLMKKAKTRVNILN